MTLFTLALKLNELLISGMEPDTPVNLEIPKYDESDEAFHPLDYIETSVPTQVTTRTETVNDGTETRIVIW